METPSTYDLTFRPDRAGNMIKGRRGEYVVNICQMLFNLVPGTDEYEPERGLAIRRKLQQTYEEKTRDTTYEAEISRQLTTYTNLVPLQVLAVYMNKSLFIYMSIQFENQIYELDMVADQSTLTAMLRN